MESERIDSVSQIPNGVLKDKRKRSFSNYATQQQRRGASIKPKCTKSNTLIPSTTAGSRELPDTSFIGSAFVPCRVNTMMPCFGRGHALSTYSSLKL